MDGSSETANAAGESMQCIAYVSGFVDGFSFLDNPRCLPKDSSIGTVIRVYANYMRINPKMMDKQLECPA
jgi:hypothetical protein